MTEQVSKKAQELYNKQVSIYGGVNSDREDKRVIKSCIFLIDQIIEALKITTGHCELRNLDWHEVQSDFKYWQQVKEAINGM